jgi:hypothetical protein
MNIIFHPETLSPRLGEAGVRGMKKKILKFRIIVTLTFPSPIKGRGIPMDDPPKVIGPMAQLPGQMDFLRTHQFFFNPRPGTIFSKSFSSWAMSAADSAGPK